AEARVARLCQRIYDTRLLIGCISEVQLTGRNKKAIARAALHFEAVSYDGDSMTDESGVLVAHTNGKGETAAMPPLFVVVSAASEVTATAAQARGLGVELHGADEVGERAKAARFM
ncbi:MAG: hypothetical protein H7066_17940, partial [Cytophagaceae bacterium]|nr:hypothetical protein [Gemmatimonadaceae bacterium]